MDLEEQLNNLTEASERSDETAEHLMRSQNLSLQARIKLFCLACMKNQEKIAEIVLNDGFHKNSDAGKSASNEIIQYLKRLDDPEGYLSGYITRITIKNDMAVMGRVGKIYLSDIFPRLKKVFLLADDFRNVELYLLDRSFLLEQGVDVNVHVCGGYPLLHIALEMGDPTVVDLLLSRGADPNMTDEYGLNSLHAAAKGVEEVVELLVDHGADIHCVTQLGETALHAFAAVGFEKGVQLLLAKGARVNLTDTDGDTPLHEACKGKPEITELLLQHGAKVNAVNENGLTPLLCAAIFLRVDEPCTEKGRKIEQVIEALVKNGADVNFVDLHDMTALHYLSGKGCERGVQLLLENGARVDSTDPYGWTPLHHAAGTASPSGRPGVVEQLLQHGAQVDARDKEGKTPLICATFCRDSYGWSRYEAPQKDVFERLLNGGADPEACGNSALLLTTLSCVSGKRSGYAKLLFEEQLYMVKRLVVHGAETQKSLAFIPSNLRPARFNPKALETALEYGLVRDVHLLNRLYEYEIHNDGIQLLNRLHEHELYNDWMQLFDEDDFVDVDDEKNRENVETLVKKHFVKLTAAGLIRSPFSDDLSKELIVLKTLAADCPPAFHEACEMEVEKMRAKILGARLTFLEVLFMSVTQLARLARNEVVIDAFSGVEKAFPIYGTMLAGRLERGKVRRRWAEKACRICQPIFDWQLRHLKAREQVPPEITEQVISNLRDVELKCFVIGDERDPIWS